MGNTWFSSKSRFQTKEKKEEVGGKMRDFFH